jgi:hypothetical protein
MLMVMNFDGVMCEVHAYQSPETLLHKVDTTKTNTRVLEQYLRRHNIDVDEFYKMEQPISLLSNLQAGAPKRARHSVKENVFRLLRCGGIHELRASMHITKPLLLGLDPTTWTPAPHQHAHPSKYGRFDEAWYREGMTLVKSGTNILINTFTQWDGELWISTCILIDCPEHGEWTIKDYVVNGFLNGLSRSPGHEKTSFENNVDEILMISQTNPWSWQDKRPGDHVYRPASDARGRAMLIDIVTNERYTYNHVKV